MDPSNLAIQTSHLNYSFGKRKVIDDLSIAVPTGSIFGFLGPNGAGKTTTMRLLTGTIHSDIDNVWLQGNSLKKNMPSIFKGIGTLIEIPSLYLHLSTIENLRVITMLRGISEKGIDEVLKTVNLFEHRSRKVKEFSLGMKQRLGIAMALLPDPSMLLLDEPANGLDPTGMIEMRELLKRLNQEKGITIFISSHLLNEVEKTCTHIGIIHKGKLRFQGNLHELEKTSDAAKQAVFKVEDAAEVKRILEHQYPLLQVIQQNQLSFSFEDDQQIAKLNSTLVKNGIEVKGINVNAGLEEWFMKIISN